MVSEGRTPNLPAAPAALATATASARHAPLLPPLENRAPRSPALFPLKTRRSPFWLLAPTAFSSQKNTTSARSREGTNWDIPASFLRFGSRKVIGVRHRAPYAKPSSPHSFETRTSRLRPTPDSLSSIEQRGHVAAQRGVTVDSLDPVPARPPLQGGRALFNMVLAFLLLVGLIPAMCAPATSAVATETEGVPVMFHFKDSAGETIDFASITAP